MSGMFKQQMTLAQRKAEAAVLHASHPDGVPVIVERSSNERDLGLIEANMYSFPADFTMSQLSAFLRDCVQVRLMQAFYLLINNRIMPSISVTLGEVYELEKDEDGFLYITYASEEVFD